MILNERQWRAITELIREAARVTPMLHASYRDAFERAAEAAYLVQVDAETAEKAQGAVTCDRPHREIPGIRCGVVLPCPIHPRPEGM